MMASAVKAARERARAEGRRVTAVELVGLVPAAAMRACSREFLEWSGLDPEATVEGRVAAVAAGEYPGGGD